MHTKQAGSDGLNSAAPSGSSPETTPFASVAKHNHAAKRAPLELLRMNQAEPHAASPMAASNIETELKARLATGEIPTCLRDALQLVDETSDEGIAFQCYQLDMLQRVFPSWDSSKHPVRILLSADTAMNAGFIRDAQPTTIVMNKGCFAYSASTPEDLAVLTLGHEITHAKSHHADPNRRNSKAEEMVCDLLPIQEVFQAGFNPLAGRDNFQAAVAKTEVGFVGSLISSFLVHPTAASRVSGIEAELTRLFLRYGDIERDNTYYTPDHPLSSVIERAMHESSLQAALRRWNHPHPSPDERVAFVQQHLQTQEILTSRLVEDIGRFLISGIEPGGERASQDVVDAAFESIITWINLGYTNEAQRLCSILSYIERGGASEATIEESRRANERCAENLDFLPPARPMGKFRKLVPAVAGFQNSSTRAEALMHGEQLLDLVRSLPYFPGANTWDNDDHGLGQKHWVPGFPPSKLTDVMHGWEWPRYTVAGEGGKDCEVRQTAFIAKAHVRLPWEPLYSWCKEGTPEEQETLRAAALECGLTSPDLPYPEGREAWCKIFAGRSSVTGFGVTTIVTKDSEATTAQAHMVEIRFLEGKGQHLFLPSERSDGLQALQQAYRNSDARNASLARLNRVALDHLAAICQERLDKNEVAPSSESLRGLKRAVQAYEDALVVISYLALMVQLPEKNSPRVFLLTGSSPGKGVADWRTLIIANRAVLRTNSTEQKEAVSKFSELLPANGLERKQNIEQLLLACAGEPDGDSPVIVDLRDSAWDDDEADEDFNLRRPYNPILFRIVRALSGNAPQTKDVFQWVCDLTMEASPATALKVLERCVPWNSHFMTPVYLSTSDLKSMVFRRLMEVFKHACTSETPYVSLLKASTPSELARALQDVQAREQLLAPADRWSSDLKQALLFLKAYTMASRRGIGWSLSSDELLTLLRNLPPKCFSQRSDTIPSRFEKLLRDRASVPLDDRIEVWGIIHDSMRGDPAQHYDGLKRIMREVSAITDPARRTKLYEDLLARKQAILEPTLNAELGNGWIQSLIQQHGEDTGTSDYTQVIRDVVARTEHRFNAINRYTFYTELADRVSASEATTEVLNASASQLSSTEITRICQGTPLIDVIANQARYSDALRTALLDFMCRSRVTLAECRTLSTQIRNALENRADKISIPVDLGNTKKDRENQAKRLHLLHRFLQTLPEELKLIPIRELVWPATQRDFWDGMAVLDDAAHLAFPGKDAGAEYARGKLKRYVRQLPDYVQPYVLGAIVSTSAKRKGGKPDIGGALSRILNEIGGPAEASVAQKAQGHPATPWEIRTALAHTKTNHAPPSRYDQWLALRSNVPAEWWTRIASNPKLIGSGKLYLAFRVEWRDADTGEVTPHVLSVLRPYAVTRGKSGFNYMSATFKADDSHPNDRAINVMIQSAQPSLETEADTPRALEMGNIARDVYGAYEIQIGSRTIAVEPYTIKAAAPGCFVSSFMSGTQLAKLPSSTQKEREERRTAFLASCATNLTALLSRERSDHDRHIGNENFTGDTLQMLDLWGVLTPTASAEVKLALTRGLSRSIARSSWLGDGGSRYLTEYLVALAEQNPSQVDEIGWHQEAILALSDKLSALGWRYKVWVFAAALNELGDDYWSVARAELGATWKGRMLLEFIARSNNPIEVRRQSH